MFLLYNVAIMLWTN